MSAQAPRCLYLHGFASGPDSHKGRALAQHLAERGIHLERLDGRCPSAERLRLSAVLQMAAQAIGGSHDRAVVFGSSLGGVAAARLAERDARVTGLVLLAPAFQVAQQLRRRFGETAFAHWQQSGWFETHDHALDRPSRVDFGFYEDAAQVDAPGGGFPDVRVPTLVIHGRADDTCAIDVTRTFARGKRHVRVIEVEDGHELIGSLPLILRESERFLAPWFGAGEV